MALAKKIWITALGVALYMVGGTVTLPYFHLGRSLASLGSFENLGNNGTSFFGVGVIWFSWGFLVVELFSLVVPAGRRLRMGGVAGREKLNRAALAAGSVTALLRAGDLAYHSMRLARAGGYPVTEAPVWLVFATLAAGALFGWLFSSPKQVAENLEGVATPIEGTYRKPWAWQLALTTLLMLATLVAQRWGEGPLINGANPWIDFFGAVLGVAVVLDLIEEGRLARKGLLESVLTLDNVHLAEYFRARFEREGIPLAIRAYHFRRLLYFFGPLYKMALVVPAAERARAAALVEAVDFKIL